MDNAQASLITMPVEIRYAIFAYLIPKKQTFLINRRPRSRSFGQIMRLNVDGPRSAFQPDYLLINRSLSSEALDMLYGTNVFTFEDTWLIEIFVARVGTANLRRVGHLKVSCGNVFKTTNTTRKNTLFSTISIHFPKLSTLRIIGVGRGQRIGSAFNHKVWQRAHLERLEYLTSLPGALNKARVYCDKSRNNSRLLCNGATCKPKSYESEVDIQEVRRDLDKARKDATEMQAILISEKK